MYSHQPHPTSTPHTAWTEKLIDLGAAQSFPVRFYGRRNAAGSTPLVAHFHGGSFISGSLDSGSTMARLLAAAGAVVVSLDYPLAPARPFPQAVEAGYAVLEWTARHRHKLGGPGARVYAAGEEAGGNLAAALALIARDRHGPLLAGQLLVSPMLDPCLGTRSLREAGAGRAGCRWAEGWRKYLYNAADADHPYAAPGASLRLGGLAPTLLVSSRDDPMRDDVHAYAKRLAEAKVAVHEIVMPVATGWPCSLFDAAGAEAEWAAALRAVFVEFFDATAAQAPRTARA